MFVTGSNRFPYSVAGKNVGKTRLTSSAAARVTCISPLAELIRSPVSGSFGGNAKGLNPLSLYATQMINSSLQDEKLCCETSFFISSKVRALVFGGLGNLLTPTK